MKSFSLFCALALGEELDGCRRFWINEIVGKFSKFDSEIVYVKLLLKKLGVGLDKS